MTLQFGEEKAVKNHLDHQGPSIQPIRKKPESLLNGLLLVDKPEGLTSHDVVAKVRRILQTRSVGHAGTLDPMATGLLVLLIGQGTKLSDYILSGNKGYRVDIQFGRRTDTLDRTGQTLGSIQSMQFDPDWLAQTAVEFQGSMDLKVPLFSATKVQGKKLYQYARQQKEVEAPEKTMEFFDIEIERAMESSLHLSIKCSKGSYIRSWVSQLGELTGAGAVVQGLCRTWSEPYQLEQAVSLDDLEKIVAQISELTSESLACCLGSSFVPIQRALPHWKCLTIQGLDERLMMNGQISRGLGRRLIVEQKEANRSQRPIGVKVLSGANGGLLSLLEAQPHKGLKIKRIFPPLGQRQLLT